MPAARYSLIAKFHELTGATDKDVAALLGIPRSTVQAYRVGRVPENLTEPQKERIVIAAQGYRQDVYEMVAEMELFA